MLNWEYLKKMESGPQGMPSKHFKKVESKAINLEKNGDTQFSCWDPQDLSHLGRSLSHLRRLSFCVGLRVFEVGVSVVVWRCWPSGGGVVCFFGEGLVEGTWSNKPIGIVLSVICLSSRGSACVKVAKGCRVTPGEGVIGEAALSTLLFKAAEPQRKLLCRFGAVLVLKKEESWIDVSSSKEIGSTPEKWLGENFELFGSKPGERSDTWSENFKEGKPPKVGCYCLLGHL